MTINWKASVVTLIMPLNLFRQPIVNIKIASSETSISAIFVLIISKVNQKFYDLATVIASHCETVNVL